MQKKSGSQGLPLDIFYLILVYLPIKTLSRFRCVCKAWSSLISDPRFHQDHYNRSEQDPFLLITSNEFNTVKGTNTLHLSTYTLNEETPINKFSKTFPSPSLAPHRAVFSQIQSCQGLVCLGKFYDRKSILLCNPSTEEVRSPPATREDNHCIGFGYTASTKEFKVVRFFSPNKLCSVNNICCEVFTVGTFEWRKARSPPPQFQRNFDWGTPFFNGALHLLSDSFKISSISISDDLEDDSIVAFHLEDEEYTEIRFPAYYYNPEEWNQKPEYVDLTLLGGSLYLTIYFECIGMDLWLLGDYDNGGWVKAYTIDLTSFGFSIVWGEPLLLIGDGIMLLSIGTEDCEESLYSYNVQKGTFTQKSKEYCTATFYVESFFPLGRII